MQDYSIGLLDFWDLGIIIFIVMLLSLFIFFLKKEKVLALLLSIYLSFVFTDEFLIFNYSFLKIKILTSNIFFPEILFVVIIGIFFFFLLKSGFYRSYYSSKYYKRKIKVYFLNILVIGLFVALSIHYFLPPYIKQNLSLSLSFIFSSVVGFFFWITVPLFSIFLIKKK